MTPDTATLLEFFESPEGYELVTEGFIPDVGGDPEDYNIADLRTVTPDQMAKALQIYMEIMANAAGVLTDEIVAATRSGSADWSAVSALIEADAYLMRGL